MREELCDPRLMGSRGRSFLGTPLPPARLCVDHSHSPPRVELGRELCNPPKHQASATSTLPIFPHLSSDPTSTLSPGPHQLLACPPAVHLSSQDVMSLQGAEEGVQSQRFTCGLVVGSQEQSSVGARQSQVQDSRLGLYSDFPAVLICT